MNQTINHGGTKTPKSLNFSVLSVSLWQKRIFLWFLPLTFLLLFFFFPLSRILAISISGSSLTSENLQIAFSALRFTFYQATLSTLFTLLLGLPSAYLFARYDFRGKTLLRAFTAVPFMLP